MSVWPLLKETYFEWDRHQAPKMGAALAYYTVLSMAPLLLVVITVVGLALGAKAAQGEILNQLRGLVGTQGAEAIQTVIANANKPATGLVASLLGLVTLFIGASGVFNELQDALDKIWDAPAPAKTGILTLLRERFLSFGMVLAIGFVLLVSLVLSAGIAAMAAFMSGILPVPGFVLITANFLLGFVVITLLFAATYKVLPSVRIEWRDVWIGAAATSALFSMGRFLIGFYLGQAGIGSAYGAAGSLVVVLVWVYYSSQVFFFGAEFTHVYAKARRPEVYPTREATVATVPVVIPGPSAVPRPATIANPVANLIEDENTAQAAPPQAAHQPPTLVIRALSIASLAALAGVAWYQSRSARREPAAHPGKSE